MFVYNTTIRLHHTDAAGVMFFAKQFELIHDAYEEFLNSHDMGINTILSTSDFIIPIAKAESDFRRPIRLGDKITIEIVCTDVRAHSFTLEYTLKKEENIYGQASTLHIVLDKSTKEKTAIPDQLKQAIDNI